MPRKSKKGNGPGPVATAAAATTTTTTTTATSASPDRPRFPIVAVGASAGGLEAFQRFLGALDAKTGMAFVLIPHLAPKHESALPEILARATRLPVRAIENNVQVEPDHVYVIPPAANVVLNDSHLQLADPGAPHGPRHPIDHFMRSIAEVAGEKAIGIVLSGTGSDGAIGVAEIRAAGGIAFAQDESAQQSSMPLHAVASGGDFLLPPEGIARELSAIASHAFVRSDETTPAQVDESAIKRLP